MFGVDRRGTVRLSGDNFGIISTGANAINIQTVLPPTAAQPAQVNVQAPTVNLPALPRDLVGRDADLARLGRAPVEVIHGLGGVGKTAIAVQHAQRYRDRCNPVWWVSAASPAGVEAGLAALASALQPGLATVMSTAALAGWTTAWLAAHAGWLLVLDDVRSSQDVADLLRRVGSGRGRIVITSRDQLDWRQITPSILRLEPLSDAAALQLLTRQRPQLSRDGAAELCQALGNLPLALDLAGAFLERTPLSPRAYRSLLANAGGVTLSPVAATWRATLQQLDTAPVDDPTLAVDILRIFAWYADSIPFDLVGTANNDPLRAAEAIARLYAANLITISDDRSTLTVNPLLQFVLRTDGANHPQQRAAIATARQRAIQCLNTVLPHSEEPATWPQWRQLHPHIVALARLVEPADDTPDLAALLNATGLYLHGQGDPATDLLRRARDAYRRTCGGAHPDTLAAANNLALAHHGQGDLTTAIGLYEETLRACEAVTGLLSPVAVACANNLACAYEESGRPGDAIRRLEWIRDRWTAAHGTDDRYALILTTNLASAYHSNNEPGQAAALLQHLPSANGWSFDAFHRLVQHAKADVDRGSPDTAIARLEPALADAVQHLGDDHPLGLDGGHTLGAAYLASGRTTDGIAMLETVLQRRTARLGPAHRDTLNTWHLLGQAHDHAGAIDRAIQLLEEAASQCAAAHGERDPDAVQMQSDLEQLRRRRGR